MDVYLQLGAGFAVLIIMMREVFSFVKYMNSRGKKDPTMEIHTKTLEALEKIIITIDKLNDKLGPTIQQTKDLHKWVSATDEDGVKKVYIRKSFIDSMLQVKEDIKNQSILMQQLLSNVEELKR